MGKSPGPAPKGGRSARARLASGCFARVGQLTPSGSRLGLIPSLRARPTRGTSLRSMLFLYGVSLLYQVKKSDLCRQADRLMIHSDRDLSREGPKGP